MSNKKYNFNESISSNIDCPVMVMPGDDDSMTKFDMAKSYPHLSRALGGEDGFDPTNCHKSCECKGKGHQRIGL